MRIIYYDYSSDTNLDVSCAASMGLRAPVINEKERSI